MKRLNESGHAVRTFNAEGKMVYEEFFPTSEKAYELYMWAIKRMTKYKDFTGDKFHIARFNDGYLMTMETITK